MPLTNKKKREKLRNIIVDQLGKLEALSTSNAPSNDIKPRIKLLEEKLVEIKDLNDKILSTFSDDDDTGLDTECSETSGFETDIFIRLENVKTSQERPTPRNAPNAYKLDKLPLTKFSGKQIDWVSFYEAFKASVEAADLPDTTKMRYLLQCLDGPSKTAIANLPIVASSYQTALQILKTRYDDPETNIEAHVNAIWEISAPSDTPSSLLSFYDNVETHIRALKSLGKTDVHLGELFTPVIRHKLPLSVRQQLRRQKGNTTWTFEQFRRTLLTEITARCDGKFDSDGSSDREPPSRIDTNPTAAFNLRARSASPMRRSCPYCTDAHKASECHKVKDGHERMEILVKQSLCLNCTGPHNYRQCPSTRTCIVCERRHHTSIHSAYEDLPPPPSQKPPNNDQSPEPSKHASRPRSRSPSPTQRRNPSPYPQNATRINVVQNNS